MKDRIERELARDDLTTEIGEAIKTAIDAYTDERFFFNETRAITFPTTQGDEFYSASANSSISDIQVIDYVYLYLGDTPHELLYMRPSDMESASTNATNVGTPAWYTWYGSMIRVYPAAAESNWIIRIGASVKMAAPASDAEANNVWMTHAERLIRSRSKYELALNVLYDTEMAQVMTSAVTEAFDQLKNRTNQLTQFAQGRVRSMPL